MNIRSSILDCHRGGLLWSLLLLGTPLLSAAPVPAMDKNAPKTHTLFMGTDIEIEQGKKLYRIRDVENTSFVISVDGAPTLVPMQGGSRNLKVDHILKLTADAVSLTGLTADRTYTPGSDPRMKRQIDASRVSAALGDNAAVAEGQYIKAVNQSFTALDADDPFQATSAANLAEIARVDGARTFAAAEMANDVAASEMTSGAFHRRKANEDLAEELYDAVEADFTLTSEKTMNTPYMVFVMRYRTRDDKPDVSRNMIYARALDPLTRTPQKIHVLQGGLPKGYAMIDYQVHIYNNGSEVATDVVPKRVPLSRDEAFMYVKIEYFSSHKQATVPATPIIGRLDTTQRAELTSAQLKAPYFVKVSKDGLPLATYTDEECSQPADNLITSLASNVRFYPALEKGRSVDGVARLVFTSLTL